MRTFATSHEAKEFLVNEIAAEAQRGAVPLAEVEREMLYFSETAWTLPNMSEVNNVLTQEYDYTEYEQKIKKLVVALRRRARKADRNELEAWDEALKRLRGEDHYILALVNVPDPLSARLFTADGARLVVTALICVCVIIGAIVAYAKFEGEM